MSGAEDAQEQGFLSHLIELRDRLMRMLLAVGVLFFGIVLVLERYLQFSI